MPKPVFFDPFQGACNRFVGGIRRGCLACYGPAQPEDPVLCEHIDMHKVAVDYHVHRIDRFLSRPKRIDNECAARVDCICLDRGIQFVRRFHIQRGLADRMEPVRQFVVRILLSGTVQVFVKTIYLVFDPSAAGNIITFLLEQVSVLKFNNFLRVVFDHFVQHETVAFLMTVQYGLQSAPIPVQVFFFQNVLKVVNQGRINFTDHIVSGQFVNCRKNIAPPK